MAKQVVEIPFVPEYHKGYGGDYYALPGKRGGTSKMSEPRLFGRCFTVYREAFCLNETFDTYEEANDRAGELAFEEEMAAAKAVKEGRMPQALRMHLPGKVQGMVGQHEVVA